jgi:hypothetical protein
MVLFAQQLVDLVVQVADLVLGEALCVCGARASLNGTAAQRGARLGLQRGRAAEWQLRTILNHGHLFADLAHNLHPPFLSLGQRAAFRRKVRAGRTRPFALLARGDDEAIKHMLWGERRGKASRNTGRA